MSTSNPDAYDEIDAVVDELIASEARMQQAQQRDAQRFVLEEDTSEEERHEEREERARRSRADEAPPVRFGVGDRVLHDLLGEASVRKLARSDDQDAKINIEWSRPGKKKSDPPILQNRWVLPSSLKKLWSSPGKQAQPTETQQGLFGAMPDLAAHERERATKMKPPVGPRGRQLSPHTTKESKVSIAQRLREFPNLGLVEAPPGELFCRPCKTRVPNIKESIKDHVGRNKHKNMLQKYVARGGDDGEVKEFLVDYYHDHPDESGSTITADGHLFRYRTVETFLKSGTPLARCDEFRPLLERSGIALADADTMQRLYIPRIEEREKGTLRKELLDQFVSIQFDGTTRLGEAINMTGRWCTTKFEVHKRLLVFVTTEKHCTAPQLASLLTARLGEIGIQPTFVVSTSRDSASTNGAACNLMLANPLINAADVMCISHTISNTGDRIQLPTLIEFTTPWLELVGGRDPHAGAKMLWKQLVAPQVVPGYSKVRWWSKAEIWFVMAENFQQLSPFIRLLQDRGIGDATTAKMATILRDRRFQLQLELAAILDVRELVKTTYELEGDRLEILVTFRRVEELRARGRALEANSDGAMPNVDALLRAKTEITNGLTISKVFPGHGTFDAMVTSSDTCESTLYPGTDRIAYKVRYPSDNAEEDLEEEQLRPLIKTSTMPERRRLAEALAKAFGYLESRITGSCDAIYDCSAMYETCRLVQAFDPAFAAQHVSLQWVDELAKVKPLGAIIDLAKLKAQLPIYLQRATSLTNANYADVDAFTNGVLEWWQKNADDKISEWALAARIIFSISPNSACCERVFALLKNMFGEQQMAALHDYIQAALMMKYNGRVVG